jgi:hypothetical protein
LSLLLLLLQ